MAQGAVLWRNLVNTAMNIYVKVGEILVSWLVLSFQKGYFSGKHTNVLIPHVCAVRFKF
jgi:hypothetical protein